MPQRFAPVICPGDFPPILPKFSAKTRAFGAVSGKTLTSPSIGVVQKYFDIISMDDSKMDLVIENKIKPHLTKMATDPNANHVLQKIISQLSYKKLDWMLEFFNKNVESFTNNPFACRVRAIWDLDKWEWIAGLSSIILVTETFGPLGRPKGRQKIQPGTSARVPRSPFTSKICRFAWPKILLGHAQIVRKDTFGKARTAQKTWKTFLLFILLPVRKFLDPIPGWKRPRKIQSSLAESDSRKICGDELEQVREQCCGENYWLLESWFYRRHFYNDPRTIRETFYFWENLWEIFREDKNEADNLRIYRIVWTDIIHLYTSIDKPGFCPSNAGSSQTIGLGIHTSA